MTTTHTPSDLKPRIMAELDRHPYRVPAWLRWNHGQTVWSPWFRRKDLPAYRLEQIDTPDDDFLRLHVLDGKPDAPTALLLHGLEGSVRSGYNIGLALQLSNAGWRVVAMEFRSCGGVMNRAKRLYHSGETTDLAFVVDYLIDQNPDTRIYIAGTSLGGNVTAKWLGESAESIPDNVAGAAVVCPPFDMLRAGPHIDQVLGGRYVKHFLKTLIPKAIEKEAQYPGCVDIKRVCASQTFEEFDTWGTAAIHGFEDAFDYWRKVACGQFLPHIRVPTMLVAAADDPFNPADTLPHETAAESPHLYPQFTKRGGHVGFVYGSPWRPRYWAEEQVRRFFQLAEESILR